MISTNQKRAHYTIWGGQRQTKMNTMFCRYKKSEKESYKFSLFETLSVAFCRPPKMRQKGDKMRKFIAYLFVAAQASIQ